MNLVDMQIAVKQRYFSDGGGKEHLERSGTNMTLCGQPTRTWEIKKKFFWPTKYLCSDCRIIYARREK
jgi:hypothetical protein